MAESVLHSRVQVAIVLGDDLHLDIMLVDFKHGFQFWYLLDLLEESAS